MKFLKSENGQMRNWLVAGVLIILALIGGTYILNQNKAENEAAKTSTNQEKKDVATLAIHDGEGVKNYELSENVVGQTALEVTQTATDGEVITSGEGENAFVISINGREASSEKKEFWEFLVNGEQAQVGAGSYIVKNGDKIEWKVSTF